VETANVEMFITASREQSKRFGEKKFRNSPSGTHRHQPVLGKAATDIRVVSQLLQACFDMLCEVSRGEGVSELKSSFGEKGHWNQFSRFRHPRKIFPIITRPRNTCCQTRGLATWRRDTTRHSSGNCECGIFITSALACYCCKQKHGNEHWQLTLAWLFRGHLRTQIERFIFAASSDRAATFQRRDC
jgi:hypothetical protein